MSDDVDEWYQQFGQRIAQARRNAGVTQTGLSDHLGMERSSVANMEAGRQKAPAHKLVVIGRFLRVDPAWLLLGDGVNAPPATVIAPRAVLRQADELLRIAADLNKAERGLRELATEEGS